MQALKRKITAGFIAALLALTAVGATSLWSVDRLTDDLEWSEHTRQVLGALARLTARLADLETGARGYVLTSDEAYLQPYTAAEAVIDEALAELDGLTDDNAHQQTQLERLRGAIEAKRGAVRKTVELMHTSGSEAARAWVKTGRGKLLMDEARGILQDMNDHERELLRQRAAVADGSRRTAIAVIVIGGAMGLFFVGVAGLMIRSDIAGRQRAAVELERLRATADHANRAKSDFLANMSHEIRTPMSAIIGYADLLVDPDQSESDRLDAANVIRRNSAHLLTVINDILDLSKIEAGEMGVEAIACSPCRVLSDVASLMRVRAMEKNLSLDIRTEGRVPSNITSDPTRLRQVLMNLAGNAIKFTESGGVTITMRLVDPADAPAPRLAFDVADTGIGMTTAEVERLFMPFVQADSSTTRRFGGSGLGLTISRRFATMLGGDIAVRSTPGQGSVFTLTITAGSLAGVELLTRCAESVIDLSRAPAPKPRRLRGRVLLAEDGADNQALLSFYLRKTGVELEVAENGRIACELAAEAEAAGKPFDLVLMDMQMPELDGYGATARLRKRGFAGPVIALTAHAMAEDREKCLRAGCTDYLSKPVKRDELIDLVAGYLAHNAAPGDSGVLHSQLVDEAVAPFIAEFVGRLPAHVGTISALLERGDWPALGQVLHQLRGAGGMYGFMDITELAARAEDAVLTTQPPETVVQHTQELIAMLRRVEGYNPRRESAG